MVLGIGWAGAAVTRVPTFAAGACPEGVCVIAATIAAFARDTPPRRRSVPGFVSAMTMTALLQVDLTALRTHSWYAAQLLPAGRGSSICKVCCAEI